MKLNLTEIEIIYDYADRFYRKEITLSNAVSELHNKGINKNSAVDYLYNFSHLVNGRVFTRTMNLLSTKYFLDRILEKYGSIGLKNALQSLSLHIDYYEGITRGNVIKPKELLTEYLENNKFALDVYFGEEITKDEKLTEGSTKSIRVNIYERNPLARKKCLEHFGAKCIVCEFDFEKKYGEIGKGFIHIHHVVDISQIGKEYEIDYTKDLVPVCPNCHAMLHKQKPALGIEYLKKVINN